ncbi:hypothetical protein ABZW39_30635, partial [Streptomyces sp. NPDC005012]
GVDLGNLDEVLEAGARRVVVVRAITEADDPAARPRSRVSPRAPCAVPRRATCGSRRRRAAW